MLIDTRILYTQNLNLNQRNVKGLSNLDLWSRVVDLDSRPFKQTKGKGLSFYGTLQADGVGVSVIKQNFASRKGGRQKKAKVLDEDVPYVDSLTPIEQRCLESRCVLVDPGRRDLLFRMHQYSEPNYRRIRETLVSNSQI
ncbi:uncharacterized protein BYT42DRAFT_563435 [Radiomyces spectabilis]|uniref:uncharacterized protein n=1 Tax=Radiomyces spectabilis TaxID=64574 RepID=UPI00221F1D72|nr:uncharacterized protein BYT42DRAFT_563435 [Radiomyces spectabilis]KAI8384717.1 hypothetical protein BYT42DRAFT_563435 [Radiomyces spectabilis]